MFWLIKQVSVRSLLLRAACPWWRRTFKSFNIPAYKGALLARTDLTIGIVMYDGTQVEMCYLACHCLTQDHIVQCSKESKSKSRWILEITQLHVLQDPCSQDTFSYHDLLGCLLNIAQQSGQEVTMSRAKWVPCSLQSLFEILQATHGNAGKGGVHNHMPKWCNLLGVLLRCQGNSAGIFVDENIWL